MFLQLNHKSLNVYQAARDLAVEVYNVSRLLPTEEKFNMVPQMRRAVLSVKLNLAEGSSRKSEIERKRYYEISRGSIVEIDAVLETAVDVGFLKKEELNGVGEKLNKCFGMLSKMLN